MWGLINGGLYFSSSWSYPVSIWPSAQVKAVIEALQSQGLGWKMVHFPPILESSSCSQLCICKPALGPLEASRGKTSLWPDAGLAHHQFSFSSWQTEAQDELCLKELLLASHGSDCGVASWHLVSAHVLAGTYWCYACSCSNVSRALLMTQFHGQGLCFSLICLCVCLKLCWYWERRSHFRDEGKILVRIKKLIWAS